MKILDTVWTTTNCELLRNWWEVEGKSAPEIMAELGQLGYRVTKNAVIGKVHRMRLVAPPARAGLTTQGRSASMKAAIAKRREKQAAFLMREKKFNPVVPPEPPISATNPPKGKKAVLLKDSKAGQCKAIIGYIDGKLENAVYCGEATPAFRNRENKIIHTSWCPYHVSIYTSEVRKR